MEKKENGLSKLLTKLLTKIMKGWKGLGDIDNEKASDVKLTSAQKKELLKVKAVGEEVRKGNRGFVERQNIDGKKAIRKAEEKAVQRSPKVLENK